MLYTTRYPVRKTVVRRSRAKLPRATLAVLAKILIRTHGLSPTLAGAIAEMAAGREARQ